MLEGSFDWIGSEQECEICSLEQFRINFMERKTTHMKMGVSISIQLM